MTDYKSLISDDEVIKELIKESKRREGKLANECFRLKPNLNFFQRTVNGLVSNNSRIDKRVDTFKSDNLKDADKEFRSSFYKYPSVKKPLVDYAFERQLVLQTKINYVKSTESRGNKVTNTLKKQKVEENKAKRHKSSSSKSKLISSSEYTKYKAAIHANSNTRKIINDISTDSEDTDTDNSIQILSDTCRDISRVYKSCISEGNDDIIFISSDDCSKTIANEETKQKTLKIMVKKKKKNHKDILNKEKTHTKRKNKPNRKKRKHKDLKGIL